MQGKELIFILGGARSGKSTYAETRAAEHGGRVLFVATAQAYDDEMRARIARHQAQRPTGWRTLEAPLGVGEGIRREAANADVIVIDCITLLASNVLMTLPEDCTQDEYDAALLNEVDDLLAAYDESKATWLVVSNEVGLGVMPPTVMGRLYRDALGRANQRLAQAADSVILMVAGLPWRLTPG